MKPSYFTDSRQKTARIQIVTFIHTLQGTVTNKDRPLNTYQPQNISPKLFNKIPKQIQPEINPTKVKLLLEKVYLRESWKVFSSKEFVEQYSNKTIYLLIDDILYRPIML